MSLETTWLREVQPQLAMASIQEEAAVMGILRAGIRIGTAQGRSALIQELIQRSAENDAQTAAEVDQPEPQAAIPIAPAPPAQA